MNIDEFSGLGNLAEYNKTRMEKIGGALWDVAEIAPEIAPYVYGAPKALKMSAGLEGIGQQAIANIGLTGWKASAATKTFAL